MLPSHLRLSAARLLPALVALGACSCGAGSTEVTEGAGRVLRLALAPVGDPPADQHSVVETLLPATMATSGRAGFANARSSASSSPTSNGPAQATLANLPTPCVEASARCAVPKASMT